jgi:ketosteroid isomerase-like protein
MAERRVVLDRVGVVQGFADALPSGDWVAAFYDDAQMARLRAYLDEVAIPRVEVEGMAYGRGGFVAGAEGGADGLIAFWREWLSPWESFTLDVGEAIEGANGVLLEVVQKGRLKGSTAVVETASAAVHYFRGGRLARIEFHLDRPKARETAGLP